MYSYTLAAPIYPIVWNELYGNVPNLNLTMFQDCAMLADKDCFYMEAEIVSRTIHL